MKRKAKGNKRSKGILGTITGMGKSLKMGVENLVESTTSWLDSQQPRSQTNRNQRVFVYGSLRKGKSANRYLEDGDLVGEAEAPGWKRVSKKNGGAMMVPGNTSTRGEVYMVDATTLRRLDKYENGYERHRIELDDGSTAWAYVKR